MPITADVARLPNNRPGWIGLLLFALGSVTSWCAVILAVEHVVAELGTYLILGLAAVLIGTGRVLLAVGRGLRSRQG